MRMVPHRLPSVGTQPFKLLSNGGLPSWTCRRQARPWIRFRKSRATRYRRVRGRRPLCELSGGARWLWGNQSVAATERC